MKSTIKSSIQADLATVWHVVTSLHDFSWRSDIISIEVFDEKHFKETSKDGYETSFTITVVEPLMKYSFLMDNENLSGEWTGYFNQTERGTEIQFTESVCLKKWWLYPFAKWYLKKHQKQYVSDLRLKLKLPISEDP
ncbi:SRPBCC family protein [Phocaeicola barnesiae]